MMRIAIIGDCDTFFFRGRERPPGTGPYRLSPLLNLVRGFQELGVTGFHYVVINREVKSRSVEQGPFGILHSLPRRPLSGTSTFHIWRRWQLLRELALIQPDLVHAQGSEEQYAFTAVTSPYRHVVTFHGIMHRVHEISPPPLFSTSHVPRWLEKLVIRRAQHVICISGETENFLRRHHSPARLHRIPNAMAPCFFQVQPAPRKTDGFTLLYVGHIEPRKGLLHLVESLPAVLKTLRQPVRLLVIGGGMHSGYQETVARRAAELKVDTMIEWRGVQLEGAVAEAMAQSDLLVLPSFWENLPMCVGEAMAAGLPVISTTAAAIGEMVEHEKTGLVVEPGNVPQLAAALIRLLSDPALRAAMGQAGWAKAQRLYTPRTVAEKTLAVYREILAGS
jgi:glycosyltransferase involved in cell wall biosynthesis